MLKNKGKRIQQKIDFPVARLLTSWRNGRRLRVHESRRGQLSLFVCSLLIIREIIGQQNLNLLLIKQQQIGPSPVPIS